MEKEPEKIIIDILLKELNLPADYGEVNKNIVPTAVIGSQNALLGTTDKLQIIVQSINDSVIANNLYTEDKNDVYTERTEQIIFATMQIDLQSRNNEARIRRHEVLSALSSVYSQQMQEKYGCRIFAVPTAFLNTGDIQGGSALNRWTIRFRMTYKHEKEVAVDYYNKFDTFVETENSNFTIHIE